MLAVAVACLTHARTEVFRRVDRKYFSGRGSNRQSEGKQMSSGGINPAGELRHRSPVDFLYLWSLVAGKCFLL
jgi:hypothetical protein